MVRLLLVFAALTLPGSLLGVTSSKGIQRPSSSTRIVLPVFWQVTKARFQEKKASTHTESFREMWTLEVLHEGGMFLTTSRARVPVFGGEDADPNIGKLSSMYVYAWKSGLKTTYYLRSRPATRIRQTTVSTSALPTEAVAAEVLACSLENPETCEVCQ